MSRAYDPDERRDTPLALKLKARISREGPLRMSGYMAACLWDREHGYYATREVIGAAGDFITSPEISQTFGELLGLWSAVVWRQMGAPGAVTLLEAGPGRGTMMRDALQAIGKVPGYAAALTVALVEQSPSLEAAQRALLRDVDVPVIWSHHGETVSAPLIVLANELLDSLPIDQLVRTGDGWAMRCVGLDARGDLVLTTEAALRGSDSVIVPAGDAPLGSVFEIGAAEPLSLGSRGAPLAALFIDYGHETPRFGDTLQAVRGHRYEHILMSPGEADLSAHVDFARLAAGARRDGLAIDGPITQAEFLGSLGIVERASRLMAANATRANEIETGVARLMNPQGMGTRFKVVGVRSPDLPPLPGFPVAR